MAALAGAGLIGARDAKHGDHSPVLSFARAEWRDFVDRLKAGAFDPPK